MSGRSGIPTPDDDGFDDDDDDLMIAASQQIDKKLAQEKVITNKYFTCMQS